MKQASRGELGRSLVTRRTMIVATQLTQALEIIGQHDLTEGRDRRQSLLKRNGDLNSLMIYKALKIANSSPDNWTNFVSQSKAPPRVKLFAWL